MGLCGGSKLSWRGQLSDSARIRTYNNGFDPKPEIIKGVSRGWLQEAGRAGGAADRGGSGATGEGADRGACANSHGQRCCSAVAADAAGGRAQSSGGTGAALAKFHLIVILK